MPRIFQGAPPRGWQLCVTSPSAPDPLFKASKEPSLTLKLYVACPSAPDPLFKASKAPFLTLWVATPPGHPIKPCLTHAISCDLVLHHCIGLVAHAWTLSDVPALRQCHCWQPWCPVVAAAAKSSGWGDLRPWSLRASCDFEGYPKIARDCDLF